MKFANGLVRVRKLVLLFLLSLPLVAAAQTQQGIWGERGISRRFLVRGNLLYAADGRGVSVYDVSNPAAIRRIDVESGNAESRDLAFIGTSDLVVATSAGLDRFAVNADGTLGRMGTTAVEGGVTRVAGTATRVAAAAGQTLLVLSRTDDALATEHSQTFTNAVGAVVASGTTAYAAVERSAIYAIDTNSGQTVTTIAVDATGLAIAGSTLWASADSRGVFAIELPSGRIRGIAGAREHRFIDIAAAGSRAYALEAPNRVTIIDGADPENPAIIATLTDWVNVFAADGNRLFVAGASVDDENLTFETGVPLRIYDLADANAPAVLGEYRDLAGPVSGVWTDGSVAYVVDYPYLRVLDISTTTAPREIASLLVPELQDWIRVKGNRAINYGRVRVNLLDVSNPRAPKLLGSWHTQGHAPSFAALARDTIIEANEHSGLHVVDYSNPADMHQISGRIFHYHDLAAGDDAVYTLQYRIFLTLDITDRRNAVDRAILPGRWLQLETMPPNSAAPHHVVLRGPDMIELFTLEDRFNPRKVRTLPFDAPGMLAASDTSVFVVDEDGVLQRWDIAGAAGFAPTDMVVTSPMQISVAGEKVVIADRYRLRVYGPDTAPLPSSPTRRRAVSH